jgi:cobalt/nickel transport system ATP-binding protein
MDQIGFQEIIPILKGENISYQYPDGTEALHDISFRLRQNQVTAIIGGNGAGKTTLFLHLNGILEPKTGHLYYNGMPYDYGKKSLMDLRFKVGIVFQDPDNQLFSASVYKDITFGLKNMGLKEEDIRQRVEKVIQATGIQDIRDKPTHFLSFGQKKRVAIAGVLAMNPEILILDEPTAGLDPQGVSELMKLLLETRERLGITVLIATHDIDMVPIYCDYVYVMEKGKFLMEGTPDAVFNKKEEIRAASLRLPRIAHLMEILSLKDGFPMNESANTISQARKTIRQWIRETKAGRIDD